MVQKLVGIGIDSIEDLNLTEQNRARFADKKYVIDFARGISIGHLTGCW